MAGRVVVAGAVNADLVLTVPALPRPGETVTGGTFARHGGGTVNGALAAELAAGAPLAAAARTAIAAAALSTRARGAREGMPRREDVVGVVAGARDEVA